VCFREVFTKELIKKQDSEISSIGKAGIGLYWENNIQRTVNINTYRLCFLLVDTTGEKSVKAQGPGHGLLFCAWWKLTRALGKEQQD
jgi:hypothetical protein